MEVKKGVEVYLHFLLPYTSTYVLRCLAGEKLSLSTSDVGKVELKLFILHTLRIGITFLEFLIRVYAVCITNSILYFSSDTTRLNLHKNVTTGLLVSVSENHLSGSQY